MRLRPGLVTDYRADTAIFRSVTQWVWFALLLVLAVLMGLGVELGPFSFVSVAGGETVPTVLLITCCYALFASIGAIGLNIVTGVAGQISLGHAFFLGIGAFTGAALGGVGQRAGQIGFGLDMIIWLPAAGLVAALVGLIVAPVATRLRGLYLAFVTLGLVVLGEHLFREARPLTGGFGVGRPSGQARLFGFRFDESGEVLGLWLTKEQKLFFLGLVLLLVMGLAAKNLLRSRVGRALSAIRDRDIAAEMMGIPLGRYKLIAFVVSSFYAGIAGALYWSVVGVLTPEGFNFLLSIQYIAMILIGGVATVSGSIMGAFFIIFLPRVVEWLATVQIDLGVFTLGLGFLSRDPSKALLDTFQFQQILFGLFIVGFLILEPMGLYGIWVRVRNYWKGWPFSY